MSPRQPYPAGTDVRETRSVTADEARVEQTHGHGSSHWSPRDWWCVGWAWVVIAFIELANAVRDGSRVQLAAGMVTLVLGALWVVRSLRRGGRPWRAHPRRPATTGPWP